MGGCDVLLQVKGGKKKKKGEEEEKMTQTLQCFQMPQPVKSPLKLPSLLEMQKSAVHLSSFLDTLEECHAVDLMKVLKAAL